jgi:hypothetical protein
MTCELVSRFDYSLDAGWVSLCDFSGSEEGCRNTELFERLEQGGQSALDTAKP